MKRFALPLILAAAVTSLAGCATIDRIQSIAAQQQDAYDPATPWSTGHYR